MTAFDVLQRMPALEELSRHGDVVALCRAFFGRDFQVVASDANVLVDDSYWHSDGFYEHTAFLRFVVYLERLDAHDGALRFLPGSHRVGNAWQGFPVRCVMQHDTMLDVAGSEVPAVAVPSEPGDVVVFDTNTLHAAWHGDVRRQLAFNVAGEPLDAAQRADRTRYFLSRYVANVVRFS